MASSKLIVGVRRGWALVEPPERKRLRLVALYGVLIAGLDTIALVLIYALISLLNGQAVTGIAGTLVHALGLSTDDRYRASLVLLAVLMMRWNVVIGGQEIAKTGKGLLSYQPLIFGRESLLAAASVLVAPFVLLLVMIRLLPPWEQETTSVSVPASAW